MYHRVALHGVWLKPIIVYRICGVKGRINSGKSKYFRNNTRNIAYLVFCPLNLYRSELFFVVLWKRATKKGSCFDHSAFHNQSIFGVENFEMSLMKYWTELVLFTKYHTNEHLNYRFPLKKPLMHFLFVEIKSHIVFQFLKR